MPNVAGLAAKPLSFARRFEQDLERIEAWYLRTADERVAEEALEAIIAQAEKIARLGLQFRPGYKNTRECPLARHPFLLIYRIERRVSQRPRPQGLNRYRGSPRDGGLAQDAAPRRAKRQGPDAAISLDPPLARKPHPRHRSQPAEGVAAV